jgi:porin
MNKAIFLILAPFLLFAQSESEHMYRLQAPAIPSSPLSSAYMTGNWDGWRDILENHGVVFASSFVTECVGNPTGGRAQGFTYTGSYGLSLDVDFSKACGWTGLEFFTSMAWRTGTSLSKKKIGNQFEVQEVYGGQTVKLNELYLKETLWNDCFAIKLGRLNGCNDFLTSPLYCQFLNLAFCGNPVSILYNTAFTDYPFAEWGAYLHFKPHDMLLVKGGVYNGNTQILKNRYHGVNFTFKSTNGVVWITELDLLVNQKEGDRYPGNYTAGFFYQTANTKIFSGGVGGDPGYYFQIDQMVYEGITPFIAMVFQPKDRNLMPLFLSSGIVFKGPISIRPDDALSLGLAYGRFSSDLGTGQNFETVFETTYWFQVNKWFSIVPDMQFILHPKGTDIPNAFCLGVQAGFVL